MCTGGSQNTPRSYRFRVSGSCIGGTGSRKRIRPPAGARSVRLRMYFPPSLAGTRYRSRLKRSGSEETTSMVSSRFRPATAAPECTRRTRSSDTSPTGRSRSGEELRMVRASTP